LKNVELKTKKIIKFMSTCHDQVEDKAFPDENMIEATKTKMQTSDMQPPAIAS
jgi:hypothetical protein